MSIVLLAIIGAKINAGVAYWVCFGLHCLFKVIHTVEEAMKE